MRFVRNFGGMLVIWQNGDGQRIGQRKDRFGGGAVTAEVVQNNREPRCRQRAGRTTGVQRGFRAHVDVNRVRSNARLQKKEEYSFAAFRWLFGEAMTGRYGTQRVLEFRNLSPRSGIRSGRKKCHVQMIGDAPICTEGLEPYADFGAGGCRRFSRGSEFSCNGVNFRWRGSRGLWLLTAGCGPAQDKQKNKPGKPGQICFRIG